MDLKPTSSTFLNGWLGPDSWDSMHACDMNRWYDFIDQDAKDHGYALDERGLIEEIVQRHHQRSRTISKKQREWIESRVDIARHILEFLEHARS